MADRGRLTEIVASRRRQGSGVAGALAGGIKERLKEKFDPRQLINQRGLLAALFPGLKTYQAKTAATEISKSSMEAASFDEIKPILETISFNTKIAAKNTMVLPALHRDVNVIRQNIVKLVKLKTGDARTKADMYFVKAKEREDKYEREIKKEMRKGGGLGKLTDPEKSESKSLLKTVLSALKKGLTALTNSLVALGKAIIGAFKLMGELIIKALSGIANFLFDAIMSLAGILKSAFAGLGSLLATALGPILESTIMKKILDFFKGGFLMTIIRIVMTSLLGWIASAKGIRFLLRFIAGPLAILFGISEFMSMEADVNSVIADKNSWDEFKRLSEDKDQTFPTSNRRGGASSSLVTEGKKAKPFDATSMGTKDYLIWKQRFTEEAWKDYKSDSLMLKRDPYRVVVPGLRDPQVLLLDADEAKSWGDKKQNYLEVLEKFVKLKNGQAAYGGADAEERKSKDLQSYAAELDSLQSDMIEVVEKNAKQTMVDPEKSNLIRRLTYLKTNAPSWGEAAYNRYIVETGVEDKIKTEVDKLKSEVIDKPINFAKDIANQVQGKISGSAEDLRKIINEGSDKAKEGYATAIESLTVKNKEDSTTTTTNPIIINETVEEPTISHAADPSELPAPASAWNNEFIRGNYTGIFGTVNYIQNMGGN
jgi:hypothetical protein